MRQKVISLLVPCTASIWHAVAQQAPEALLMPVGSYYRAMLQNTPGVVATEHAHAEHVISAQA